MIRTTFLDEASEGAFFALRLAAPAVYLLNVGFRPLPQTTPSRQSGRLPAVGGGGAQYVNLAFATADPPENDRNYCANRARRPTRAGVTVPDKAELADAVVHAPPERQLKIVRFEEARREAQMFKTFLPLYGLRAAAGYFGNGEAVEPEGWIEAVGRSMEPTIRDGDYLVSVQSPRERRSKKKSRDGGWRHASVTLSPTNPDYKPVVFTADDANDVKVVAEFVKVSR